MTATVGSLFAGVGGFDLGMERAGFTVLWQAEWDKHCQSVLRRHWPDSTLYGDVTDVNGAEIAPVDVITFGSPCQDLSVAGKRAGLDGDRSSMFFQAIRIIKEMRDATDGVFPRIAVWENVPGSLSSNKGADFGVVLDALADVGAVAIEWAVLDARWFGVPQRRRRVFVVAVFDPAVAERCPDPLLPVGEGRRRDSAKGKPKGKDAATSFADRIGSDSGNWAVGDDGTDTLRTAVTSKWHKGSAGPSGDEAYNLVVESPAIPVLPGQQELFDQPFVKSRRAQSTTDHETWVEGDVAPTLNAFDNATETRATVVVPTIIFENSFRDGIRINDDISHTLPAKMGTGGGNQPHVAQPLVYDGYNQDLDDSGVHRTLRIGRDSSDFVAQPVTVFQPGTMLRLGGGVWEDTVPTLRAEAKRGDNEPHIAQPIPIQDGREIEKHQNGLGIADEGSPAYTLDQTGAQSVAQPYSFDTQFGSNANVFTDLSPTLKATQASPSVAFSVREDAKANTFSATPTDVSLCLTGLVPSPQSHHAQLFIAHPLEYAVRRLTPLECERLMGWPDDHTRWTDDGREQADSHRYRQCGNGVATPVAAWIGSHLLPLLEP